MGKDKINTFIYIQTLKEKIAYILKKWKILIIFILIGILIGVYVSHRSKPVFIANLKFVLEDGSSSSGGLTSIASSFGIGALNSESIFSTVNVVELLQTRNFIEKALLEKVDNKKITFAELLIKSNDLKKGWKKVGININFKINDDRSKFSRLKDSILGTLYLNLKNSNSINLNVSKDHSIVSLEIKSKSEDFSRYFPETLLKIVTNFHIKSKTKKTVENIFTLQKQTDSIRKELLNTMTSVAISNDEIFGLNPAMNIKRVPSTKKQVDVQANTLILGELVKNLELAKMELYNKTPLVQIVDSPILPLEQFRWGLLKSIIIFSFVFIIIGISFIFLLKSYKENKN